MHTRTGKFGVFFLVLLLCVLLIFLSQISFFSPIRGSLEKVLISGMQLVHGETPSSEVSTLEKLKTENQKLKTQLAKEYLLIQENQALHDQFAKSESEAKTLLPATVLSHRDSGSILLDHGAADGVTKNDAVLLNDNLVGIVTAVTPHTATVQLTIAKDFSIASQTVKTNALGVAHGMDTDGILFQNVLLSDSLKPGDFVATKGESNDKQAGLPPNLIVGRIISIDKKASALYQTAKVESLIDFARIRTVFVLLK